MAMNFFISAPFALAFLIYEVAGTTSCGDTGKRFRGPDTTNQCMDSCKWIQRSSSTHYIYPKDFDFPNFYQVYRCDKNYGLNRPQNQWTRVIVSNAIPDHNVAMRGGSARMCETPFAIEIPDPNREPVTANPADDLSQRTEIPSGGMIAIATNGVPAFGAQEVDDTNAVEPPVGGTVLDAGFWYGHPTGGNVWHVHNPFMGERPETATNETLLGWAMDGFPIYGPLDQSASKEDIDLLVDDCNGVYDPVTQTYRYHVRTFEQVDDSLNYCLPRPRSEDDSKINNWKYILGCYSGNTGRAVVGDRHNATWMALEVSNISDPNQCTLEYESVLPDPTPNPTPMPTDSPVSTPYVRPNIIIIQPDDLSFLDDWTPPPINPDGSIKDATSMPWWDVADLPNYPDVGMHNIERLRTQGVQMMQAYTTSPVCGTSRYSTITGKYPSRSGVNRNTNDHIASGNFVDPASVKIRNTKLEDRAGYKDCSEWNLAAALNASGYATGMFGKWHLTRFGDNYSYAGVVEEVQNCGFDTVGGLYAENLDPDDEGRRLQSANAGVYDDGTFSHNMEWVTYDAVEFLKTTGSDPFFMYFNPTIPHGANDVETALLDFPCTNTTNGKLDSDPYIVGMTAEYSGSCDAYRQTVIERAGDNKENLGKIWLDDAVGALMEELRTQGKLDDTIILFQEDHGMDVKEGLYEGGVRIPQFIHYPKGIPPSQFHGLVSVIDIAPTMLDFANVPESEWYDMDGSSWKNRLGNAIQEEEWKNDRCLFFEVEEDRAIRCGCYKYLKIYDEATSTTYDRGDKKGLAASEHGLLFDLCDENGDYEIACDNNKEVDNLNETMPEMLAKFQADFTCHLNHTHPVDGQIYEICDTAITTTSPTPAPNGGANSDPLILGLHNQVFKFEGRDGGWYANLANIHLQWNMRFKKFQSCPADENMFVSELSFNTNDDDTGLTSNILIVTTPEPVEECRSDPDMVCLGAGTLHISIDGGLTFLSQSGDYHFGSDTHRIVAHNTYAACSRKWHDYEVSQNNGNVNAVRDGGRFLMPHRKTVQEKKPLQLLKDNKGGMIDSTTCAAWMKDREERNDLFEQRGEWSTIYIETPLVSFHVEYRRSNFFDPTCDFQSLDAWMTKVSDKMEKTEWSGILGETKHKLYDLNTGAQIVNDRQQILRGKYDSDYEVGGPLETNFLAKATTSLQTNQSPSVLTRVVSSVINAVEETLFSKTA